MAAARTTISLDSKLYEKAVKRAEALGYKSFSAYVEYLIAKDVTDRGSHVVVREEPENDFHPRKKA